MKNSTDPFSVIPVSRQVIDAKLLDTLNDDDKVAIIATEDDLNMLIGGLLLLKGPASFRAKAKTFAIGLDQLRKAAFLK